MLEIHQTNPHSGFLLAEILQISSPISLFVGKNGAGKTRFFQAIKESKATVSLDGEPLQPGINITTITQAELTPHFGMHYDEQNHNTTITNAIRKFEQQHQLLDQPYTPESDMYDRMGGSPPASHIHKLANSIAKKLNKKPSELTQEEFKLHYDDQRPNMLGHIDVAAIFNQYVKRINDNEQNEWKKLAKGRQVPSYTPLEFVEHFGEKPWIPLNEILASVFDGKYKFPEPDVTSLTYDHQTPLLDLTGRSVATSELSSGERTLLWLALSIFKTQYSNIEFNDPPKLLLMDEPDAYLHPKMVEKMYVMLTEFHQKFDTRALIITHSPTTAALCPYDSIYSVATNSIVKIDKDEAIAQLLEGVSQISISPENRRQVFVESYYDAALFQALFNWLKSRSEKINEKISITFTSAGPKIPTEHINQKIKQILGDVDVRKLAELNEAINGNGSCSQVYGIVEDLQGKGVKTAKGLVDWDGKNQHNDHVKVFAKDYAYSIENVFLDPIAVLLHLHLIEPAKFTIKSFCGYEAQWQEWLKSENQLQTSVNYFIQAVLGEASLEDATIEYRSGIKVFTDKRYLEMQGHNLEDMVYRAFPKLKSIATPQRPGGLKQKIAELSMLNACNGALIPKFIEDDFAALQQ